MQGLSKKNKKRWDRLWILKHYKCIRGWTDTPGHVCHPLVYPHPVTGIEVSRRQRLSSQRILVAERINFNSGRYLMRSCRPGISVFSCDQAALWTVLSVCPVRLSVTPFSLCPRLRIILNFFRSYYHWQKWWDSRFKHHLFRKYTVIHNGIFIMSIEIMYQYDMSMQKVKVRGQNKFCPNLGPSGP